MCSVLKASIYTVNEKRKRKRSTKQVYFSTIGLIKPGICSRLQIRSLFHDLFILLGKMKILIYFVLPTMCNIFF